MITTEPPAVSSIAGLFKMAFQGLDLGTVRANLCERLHGDPSDAAAWVDLGIVQQLLGNQVAGSLCQENALRLRRLYRSSWPTSATPLRVLALMIDGDVNANTPIDFLLEGFDVVLYSLYVAPEIGIPDDLPEHDVAIVTISESDRALSTLQAIEGEAFPNWGCPILNNPSRIVSHSRERMFRHLSGVPGMYMPPTVRFSRFELQESACDGEKIRSLLGGATFPIIVRPIDSHAGNGLEKLEDAQAVESYLATQNELEFFVSPFVDYRSHDGLFRKYRIMWIDGRPYPVHMAIADQWKVWYLNADMASHEWKRAEEERFLSAFDGGFGTKHKQALEHIADRFGLEYFGIDCGELPDGRLLVFEGSVALVAHDMDSPDLYPYKSPQMRRLFGAFYDMLKRKAKPQNRLLDRNNAA